MGNSRIRSVTAGALAQHVADIPPAEVSKRAQAFFSDRIQRAQEVASGDPRQQRLAAVITSTTLVFRLNDPGDLASTQRARVNQNSFRVCSIACRSTRGRIPSHPLDEFATPCSLRWLVPTKGRFHTGETAQS